MGRFDFRRAMHFGLAATIWMMLILIGTGCRGDAVSRSTRAFPQSTGFVRREMMFDGKPQPLWVFIPKNYSADKQSPAIVFLHGLFEAGNGETSCLSGGLGPVIAEHPENWPFITIFPQSTGTWRGPERDRFVIASLDYAEQQYSIDPDRVILAGLSYGALGTWQIGANHPDRFAALVPVSGHRATELVERLVLLPVWAFDMRGDPIVSSQNSEEMCRQIDQHHGVARLTEFLGVGHDCWELAVHQSTLVDWMLEQRRRPIDLDPRPTENAMAKIDMDQ
ncbi:MAG TPA: prolyl oligopeptidase family serine peptidase [Tepidisphaeraceae bacterium]|jgi:predicted peptidase|nr:prolyl oligopeptidase family serine peptidase [Tepidisphaeraceae bacterium]